jgi:hypothetical protein
MNIRAGVLYKNSGDVLLLTQTKGRTLPHPSGEFGFQHPHMIMVYPTFLVDFLALLCFLASIRAIYDYRRRAGLPYPPGPRPLPIVGNFFNIPKDFTWLAYTELSKTYGTLSNFLDVPFKC